MSWGKIFWTFLHSAGFVYKVQYNEPTEEEKHHIEARTPGFVYKPTNRVFTDEEKYNIEQFFRVWCYYVWCPKCEQPCKLYVEEHATQIISWTSTSSLWDFALDFHNHVNQKTGKPILTSEVAEAELIKRLHIFFGQVTNWSKCSWFLEDYLHIVTMMMVRFLTDVNNFQQQINTIQFDIDAANVTEEERANRQNRISMLQEDKRQCVIRTQILMKSFAYLLPFQFTKPFQNESNHNRSNDTIRDIWLRTISTWNWDELIATQTCYEHLGQLYQSLFPSHLEIRERLAIFLNRESYLTKIQTDLSKLDDNSSSQQKEITDSSQQQQQQKTIDELQQRMDMENNASIVSKYLKVPDHWYFIIFVMFVVQIILIILLCRSYTNPSIPAYPSLSSCRLTDGNI